MYPASSQPDVSPLLVLPVGDFGWAAALEIRRLLPHAEILDQELDASVKLLMSDPQATAVLTAWRPTPAILELLDARAYRTQSMLTSLTIDDGEMAMGPLIRPGFSYCGRCWTRRVLQADQLAGVRTQKRLYYSEHSLQGPRGYLPSLALFGAAQIAKSLEEAWAGKESRGVLRMDMYTRQLTTESYLGIDNCDRCGMQRPLDTRSYLELQASLEKYW